MSPIDASKAWAIVRTAPLHHDQDGWTPAEGLRIAADGGWSADTEIAPDAAWLFDTLLPLSYGHSHYVIAQIGQSLDGRIATLNGRCQTITGRASRVHLHRLRALVDAVVVGVNTVIADDPQLTVRHVCGASPVRVVLDPHARAPHDRRIFTDGGPRTFHAIGRDHQPAPGSQGLVLSGPAAGIVPELLAGLAGLGYHRILIEGGSYTISRFIEAQRVDRLQVVVAPFLIGAGHPALALHQITSLDQAIRPACRRFHVGNDTLYDLDLRHPAAQ